MIKPNKLRFLALFLLLALVGISVYADAPRQVLCFGDSITEGTHINGKWTRKKSWVNLLEERSGGTLKCINAGRSGRQTGAKQQLIPFMEKNPQVKTVILFLGVNDLRNSKQAVLERCVTNTQWMIDKIKETYGADTQIMVLSSPGIVAEAVWNGLINNGSPAKVACIGDSITAGAGIKNKSDKYPAQLQQLLGAPYKVTNYGISARTLLKKGDHPYWNEARYKKALSSNPNYVIIKLGTNDTKPKNWKYKNEFRSNLKELAQSFITLPSRPKFSSPTPLPCNATAGASTKKISPKA